MRSWARVAVVAALTIPVVMGCDEEELDPSLDAGEEPSLPREDAGKTSRPDDEDDAGPVEDAGAEVDAATKPDGGALVDQRSDAGQGAIVDARAPEAVPDAAPTEPPSQPGPIQSPRTEVPDELVGAWHDGALDFVLWENYRQGYWAGRNAAPSREAMIFSKNGDAKFYRYEFAFNLYEELIDCEGTVAFHEGTFTFYPIKGRKRFIDARHSQNSVDRPLTPAELISPKLAGQRAYAYDPSDPSTLQITVPSSAPYNWYRKE